MADLTELADFFRHHLNSQILRSSDNGIRLFAWLLYKTRILRIKLGKGSILIPYAIL
jgi:hypothetical protein